MMFEDLGDNIKIGHQKARILSFLVPQLFIFFRFNLKENNITSREKDFQMVGGDDFLRKYTSLEVYVGVFSNLNFFQNFLFILFLNSKIFYTIQL